MDTVRFMSKHVTRDIDILPCRYRTLNQIVAASMSKGLRCGFSKHSIIVSMDGESLTPSLERSRRKSSRGCLNPSFSHMGDVNTCRDMLATSRAQD